MGQIIPNPPPELQSQKHFELVEKIIETNMFRQDSNNNFTSNPCISGVFTEFFTNAPYENFKQEIPDIKKFSEYKTIALKNLRTVLTNKKIKNVEDVLMILGNLSDDSVHSFICKVNNRKLKKGALKEVKELIRSDELDKKHEWLKEL